MPDNFFPQRPDVIPTIYAYTIDTPTHKGLLKVGYTGRDVPTRVKEQVGTSHVSYKIIFEKNSMRDDGSAFDDNAVHKMLAQRFSCEFGEWYRCSVKDVENAAEAVREHRGSITQRTQSFGMRPEQQLAVKKTQEYFAQFEKDNPDKPPRFLWNAKMRFGKTFTSYEFAKAQGYKRVLVLTFKPAVENSWREDLESHKDFAGWQFISRETELDYEHADKNRPIVCFGSFQDYLGKNEAGGIKARNEWVHEVNWDLVIFDEYHFGAWRDSARELFEEEDKREQNDNMNSVAQLIDEGLKQYGADFLPITTGAYLFLSGTPFRAIANGEFIEEQIFNWTYSDEQSAKEAWPSEHPRQTKPLRGAAPHGDAHLPDARRDPQGERECGARGEGERVHQLPVGTGLRRERHATGERDRHPGHRHGRNPGDAPGSTLGERAARERGQRHPTAHHGQRGRHAGAHEHRGLPKPQRGRGHRDHHYPEFPAPP